MPPPNTQLVSNRPFGSGGGGGGGAAAGLGGRSGPKGLLGLESGGLGGPAARLLGGVGGLLPRLIWQASRVEAL